MISRKKSEANNLPPSTRLAAGFPLYVVSHSCTLFLFGISVCNTVRSIRILQLCRSWVNSCEHFYFDDRPRRASTSSPRPRLQQCSTAQAKHTISSIIIASNIYLSIHWAFGVPRLRKTISLPSFAGWPMHQVVVLTWGLMKTLVDRHRYHRGRVAQWIARMPTEHEVDGSTPSVVDDSYLFALRCDFCCFAGSL